MATGMSMVMVLMMAVMQGAGNDLVDYVDAQSYWQEQELDRTVETLSRIAAEDLAAEAPKKLAIRRLVAIRTLGELENREALPVLTKLLKSRQPFVADYAAEAIARIEGRGFTRPGATDAELASDVALLPARVRLVTQIRVAAGGPIPYDKVFDAMGQMGKEFDRDQARKTVTKMVVESGSITGNLRLQGITMGVSDDPGPRTGFVVLIGRIRYDVKAVRAALKTFEVESRKVDGVEVFDAGDGTAVMLVSDRRLIVIGGGDEDQLPVEEVVKALAAGRGKLADDKVMTELLNSVDRTKPVWLVAKMTEAYKEVEMFAAFDSITAFAEKHRKHLRLNVLARGNNPDKIKTAVKQFEDGRAEALEELKRESARAPFLKDLADFVSGLKVHNAGNVVTLTGTFKGNALSFLAVPMMMGAVRYETRVEAVGEVQAGSRK